MSHIWVMPFGLPTVYEEPRFVEGVAFLDRQTTLVCTDRPLGIVLMGLRFLEVGFLPDKERMCCAVAASTWRINVWALLSRVARSTIDDLVVTKHAPFKVVGVWV